MAGRSFSGLAAWGAMRAVGRLRDWGLIYLLIFYPVGIAAVFYGGTRYGMVVYPCLLFFSAADPFVWMAHRLRTAFRDQDRWMKLWNVQVSLDLRPCLDRCYMKKQLFNVLNRRQRRVDNLLMVFQVNVEQLWQIVRQARRGYLLAAMALMIGSTALRTVRWVVMATPLISFSLALPISG